MCQRCWTRRSGGGMSEGDPFAALGLTASRDVSDDDVRAAWRRIASGTHPDRDDGGSPEQFAAAAAAYATLRTPFGRGEALADLAEAATAPSQRTRFGPPRGGPVRHRPPSSYRRSTRRGLRLAVRLVAIAAVAAFGFAAAGWSPGTVAVLAGAATWLIAILRNG